MAYRSDSLDNYPLSRETQPRAALTPDFQLTNISNKTWLRGLRDLLKLFSFWIGSSWVLESGCMDRGGLDRGPCRLPTIHTRHTHWMCYNSVMIPSGHMTSIHLSILERDPPLLLSWRFLPCASIFSYFWEFFLIRCEVKGQGCKALWGKFVICDIGLHKINWIE